MKTKTAEERKEQTETLLELYRNSDLLNGILVKHPQDAVQIQNEVIELMRLAIYTSPSQLPASVPTDWWDDERFIELKNAHLDIICKGILEYNGTGKFGSPELQKIADIVHRSLNHPPVMGEGEKEQQIFFTYDKQDGEVFCAFTDEERARKEAEECTAGLGETRLVIGKRTPTPSSQHLTGR